MVRSTISPAEQDTFHVEHPGSILLTNCPKCGVADLIPALDVMDHTVSHRRFQLADCARCGFRTTNPRPSPEAIGAYYESEDYISHANTRKTLQDKLYQLARKWALRKKFAIVSRYRSQGKVLDVGCGTGEFLAYLMVRGYSVQGIEPSSVAAGQTRNHNIPVVPNIDQLLGQEQFDLVTMWHVLEHLHDLRGTFKRLYALLAEGGHLLIAVPDRDSWDAHFFGAHWAAWDVPRHLSHFRRKDVFELLRDHGFEVIGTKRMLLDAPYIAMLSSKYQGAGPWKALIKGITLGTYSNLVSLISQRPTSSTLYIARKAEV